MVVESVPPFPSVPVIYWRRFAGLVGLDEEVIRGMCEKGHLPTVRFGKYRFVNVALLTSQCLQQLNDE
jgi:hypothetical protein